MNGIYQVRKPKNEPVRTYEAGSLDRHLLEEALEELKNDFLDIPLIIGGKEIRTGSTKACILPHDHQTSIGHYHQAGQEEVAMAIEAALEAKASWEKMPFQHKASIFLKAAELLSTTWRYKMNAATMLVQSKNPHQAEIDVVCELIDFFKFNVHFMENILRDQALSTKETWNRVEYTGLDGFIYAVSPFNFTSIGGNLACAPALCGNVVLWKPASTAVYSNYMIMKLLEEAGMPKGVINFVPGPSQSITDAVLDHPEFSGFHYTGSTSVFSNIWLEIAKKLPTYRSYPRIVGETGGKNFVFAHHSADIDTLVVALVRGAFEYQGQKCSAAARTYIPESIWPQVKDKLLKMTSQLTYGPIDDFKHFVNAVIDKRSFDRIKGYIEKAQTSSDSELLFGGSCDDKVGYFVEPTIIQSFTPDSATMVQEIFGPVLTVYVYKDEDFIQTLNLCESSSPYALTGAIFAKDRDVLLTMENHLKKAAGNLYINDKPTGAVVGQQPFGGSRASGTNDKAGSKQNLMRWINTRVVKENFSSPTTYEYPFMSE
ncbi:L-glutamate gamma-semialdehyde dehydrogenase [Acidaminobacter sp. JC074]|uniref:L-glutamate gamma-semialdehyde dehydrogenase n=1 Tax=Acidaminobacter sp. JC074 TaxID=2530199 RepID=UPI001F10CC2A|nr:L-glutamate gamma-semialdehyde dehydrogenase [Acidaminobacter sp. JC074]